MTSTTTFAPLAPVAIRGGRSVERVDVTTCRVERGAPRREEAKRKEKAAPSLRHAGFTNGTRARTNQPDKTGCASDVIRTTRREQMLVRYHAADAAVRLIVRCLLSALLFPVGCAAAAAIARFQS